MQARRNIIRNMMNFLKSYLLHSPRAEQALLLRHPDESRDFRLWADREMVISNFEEFRAFWATPHPYLPLARQLAFRFLQEEGVCAIVNSRLQPEIKEEYIAQLNKFNQGI